MAPKPHWNWQDVHVIPKAKSYIYEAQNSSLNLACGIVHNASSTAFASVAKYVRVLTYTIRSAYRKTIHNECPRLLRSRVQDSFMSNYSEHIWASRSKFLETPSWHQHANHTSHTTLSKPMPWAAKVPYLMYFPTGGPYRYPCIEHFWKSHITLLHTFIGPMQR